MNRISRASLAVCLLLSALACGGGRQAGAPSTPSPAPQVYPVETLQVSGDPANRINVVLLGDGYTQAQQDKLSRDAQCWLAAFKATVPYGTYATYFNVKLVHVISQEDGASNGMHGLGTPRSTALGATFQNASPAGRAPAYRLLVVDNALAQAVAAAHAPECTKVLVLVNDTNYGGSGGIIPVISIHPDSGLISLHELGHSLGGLADEYACGDTSALQDSMEDYPNVTACQSLDLIKWRSWIAPGMPLPTPDTFAHSAHVGLFEGALYHDAGVYRPRHSCRMRSLNDGFCEVCSEALVHGIYHRVHPIDAAFPPSPVQLAAGAALDLSITHPVPSPNTLQVAWTLDGLALEEGGDHLALPAGTLAPGTHQISARLTDATPLVRHDMERLTEAHSWTVNVGGSPSLAPQPSQQGAGHQEKVHQLLRVVRDPNGFRVLDRKIVDLPLPPESRRESSAWQVDALGPDGRILFSMGIENPTLLRGEFQGPLAPEGIDGMRRVENRPTTFLLRIPLMDVDRLECFESPKGRPRIRLGVIPLKGN